MATPGSHSISFGTVIYRVQNWNGRGPYQPTLRHAWSWPDPEAHDGRTQNPLTHPIMKPYLRPGALKLRLQNDAFGFGFRHLGQLCDWFAPPERAILTTMGFRAVSMVVQEIIAETDRQLLFWRDKPLYVEVDPVPW